MWGDFAPHIFSSKNISTLDFRRTRILNESLTNDFVKLTMLWTTGPWFTLIVYSSYSAGEEKYPYFLFHGETALCKILKFQGETANFSEKFQGEIAEFLRENMELYR